MVALEGLVRIATALNLTPATLLEIPEFQTLEKNIAVHRAACERDTKFYEKVGRMVSDAAAAATLSLLLVL